jgi:hypothetical protein
LGRLEHGFLRVRCDICHTDHLVAFGCKRRGFCLWARRMGESAALLVDEFMSEQPMRQCAHRAVSVALCVRQSTGVLHIVYRVIAMHISFEYNASSSNM